LKVAKLCQESYANKRRRPLQFEAGDHVYLKVSLMKGVKRFGVTGKLSPRYIGPFQILEKCGKVAYKLELRPSLVGVHDIFHVSQLKKCLKTTVDIVFTGSGNARYGFDISRTSDQDLGPKESCHKAQDDQFLQDPMEQPYRRRSNMGE
jgi:hypothetical protein